jgi:phi LC3 family holin
MINFKLRLQNKYTLAALGSLVILLLQKLGVPLPSDVKEILDILIMILVTLGVVVDPTTKGVSDSKQAMEYTKPKG